jgi:phospho-N-acetylmuramoyl-pentapeptide-transferase
MMLPLLRESLQTLFITIFASAIFAPIMIEFLYRFGQVSVVKKTKLGSFKGTNALFRKIQNVEVINGTPNIGGIMVLVVVPLVSYFLIPLTLELKIVVFGFVLFGIWGLVDVLFINAIKNNEKLRALQETFEWRAGKLLIGVFISGLIIYLLHRKGLFVELEFWHMLTIAVSAPVIAATALLGLLAVYAAEITDGLDGLMIGVFGIIIASLGLLLIAQGQYLFVPFIAVLIGVIVVDLYFNIPPARFWNGGPGAMPLGFAAFIIALMTNNLVPYLIMTAVTWGIMASSMLQILSMKFLKRRIFKIAPIHHHFQAVGWPHYKVTMRFWLFTVAFCLLGVFVGLVI